MLEGLESISRPRLTQPKPNCYVKNYLREIIAWRIAAAVLWSIFFQYLTGIVIRIVFAVDIDYWHPTTWIPSIIRTPLYLIPLGAIIFVHGVILSTSINSYGHTYMKYNRAAVAFNVLTINSLLLCIAHICTGGLFFWLYLQLVDNQYSKLSSTCKDLVDSNCLVESHMYVIMCGVWMGMALFIKDHVITSKIILNFPSVQQRKYRRVITELVPIVKKSFHGAILPSILFVLIYFWLGNSIKEISCQFFNLRFEDHASRSYIAVLSFSNAKLLVYSWVLSSVYMFTINMLELLLQVFLMQHITFPITPTFGNLNSLTLCQMLNVEEIRIMHHLGYLDLMLLAGRDRLRRKELFSLSQPGGHPYNWNVVLEECLKLVNMFTADLNIASNEHQLVSETTQPSKDIYPHSANKTASTSQTGMRNLSMHRVVDVKQPPANLSSRAKCAKVAAEAALTLQVDMLKQKILKNSVTIFLFGELHEKRLRHILVSKGQLVIWTTQSLALLASASFEEDSYGVVQKDLPAIITALLQLKQILDKLLKAGSYKKPYRNDSYDIRIKNALRSAVKRSLYRITVTFGQYVKELPLSNDALQQIQNFLMFKEG